MKNLFIHNLNQKDLNHFTTDLGLYLRRKSDKPFKKVCNKFTNANIIRVNEYNDLSDDEYFSNLDSENISSLCYPLIKGKNNIVLERYPKLDMNESYIFVCNHTCPEDIETVLNILDRNVYVVLGSIESLKYNPEMYLLWLNGMIPFDILNKTERQELLPKMARVLKTNSVLIFPEGSHNYHPNKIINNLFDGAVNSALDTGKKIVPVTLVKDLDNNISYIDVGNPIDLSTLNIKIHDYYPREDENEKYFVKSLSSYIRDKMATAVYYILLRHFSPITRSDYSDIDKYFKDKYIHDAFSKLKWKNDVFEAEYLIKKEKEENEYEEVTHTLANLILSYNTLKYTQLNNRDYILKEADINNKNVATYMKDYWVQNYKTCGNIKKLVKK